ncbi:enoyl-CoA hydratase/isomerase family protein [Sphingomonas fennica]|uniref:Enoyl-CoA hydratase n=1 Tax=Edaphosphingomonas fennica TaxID=114404 RepID=A0A2T4HVZ7_9SPHN|nr:enoyl-CoA hydratase/isomerase family protein [Sphingomonas fennica]PTD19971.1 enoyl-CoA hydratase [Sphingomonas fennica]
MPAPADILSPADLAALAARQPMPEEFGPDSPRPLIAFALADADPALGPWLAHLPCPVIGIGAGPLDLACDVVLDDADQLGPIARNVAAAPIAAMVLVQHLRASAGLPLESALTAESFAYATLQQGPEFKRLSFPRIERKPANQPAPVEISYTGTGMGLRLNRPATLNAIDAEMRDALCEALDIALLDPDAPAVRLTAAGRAFSTGGEVAEFGLAADPATAHWVRSLRLPARRIARLADRLSVHVHGAAIGAGLEIAAFARHLTATPDAWFQLPELKYGLIPGAGGTASLPRRIGRQRTAYLALSMRRLSAAAARDWGLVDAIVE